jgi:FKBP-type peptidyl-prolyl cis-trans isomerase SlyD
MEKLVNNDFIELEFTGYKDNDIFDTTNKVEAEKLGLSADVKPMILSIGNQMVLKGLDDDLVGKELEKKYSIMLSPDNAFGKRNPTLVKTVPIKVFLEKNINPYPGMTVQLDNYVARILSVSGGRVTVDFNNPLAGKDVRYDYIIKRKVTDVNEKINAIQDFFFRQRFEYVINENKVIFNKKEIKPFIDLFKDKFKIMIGLDFDVEEKK